jgi:hypothetical protein
VRRARAQVIRRKGEQGMAARAERTNAVIDLMWRVAIVGVGKAPCLARREAE